MSVELIGAPMREFLLWVARSPRTYTEAIEAWGSHCPRFTVWEDAFAAGFVEIEHRRDLTTEETPVRLTSRGQANLPD